MVLGNHPISVRIFQGNQRTVTFFQCQATDRQDQAARGGLKQEDISIPPGRPRRIQSWKRFSAFARISLELETRVACSKKRFRVTVAKPISGGRFGGVSRAAADPIEQGVPVRLPAVSWVIVYRKSGFEKISALTLA